MRLKLRLARCCATVLAILYVWSTGVCLPDDSRRKIPERPLTVPAPVEAPERPWTPPPGSVSTEAAPPAPVPAPGKVWDLPSLVDFALAHSPQTRLSWAQSRVAAALMGEANSAFYPRIDLEATATRSRGTVPFIGITRSQTIAGPGARLNYILYDFGARRALSEEARHALVAAGLSHNAAIQDVAIQVQDAFYRLAGTKAMLAARDAGLKEAQAALDAAEERHRTGVATIADVAQARAALASARLLLQTDQGEVEIARGVLAALVGWAPNSSFQIVELPAEPPVSQGQAEVEALLREAKAQRPDLAALEAEVAAARARLAWARAQSRPTISITGTTGVFYHSARQNSGQDSWFSPEYAIGAALRFPLFTGHQTEYVRQEAEAVVSAAGERRRLLEQQIGIEVWSSYHELRTAADRVSTSAELLASAQQSYEVNLGQYQAGVGDILGVLSAQATLEDARSQDIRARTDWYLAAARLAYATGTLTAVR